MRYDYNKLVRDKIPEEINKIEGRKANYKILDEEEYQKDKKYNIITLCGSIKFKDELLKVQV